MLKRSFCWLYDQWLSKAVNAKTDPLVRLLDFVAGSECKYCMAVRCLMLGFGSALIFLCPLAGLAILALAFLFTLGERYWLCVVK
jgi:hypothetical protein